MKKILKSIFFTPRFFIAGGILVILFGFGFYFPFIYYLTKIALYIFILLTIADIVFLYSSRDGIKSERVVPERFSNGDENPVQLNVESGYRYDVDLTIIDDIPDQFQMRNFRINTWLKKFQKIEKTYYIRPVKRGEYVFGKINFLVKSKIGFAERKISGGEEQKVKVYPAFLQMRQFELMAISNRLTEFGVKQIRKMGQSMEFEQIRQYVLGDDYRLINWKATARKNSLMVNQYTDEKSQNVYSMIDMGRTMKMPFRGMSLVDYAINSTLVLSDIAVMKQDKAGLLSFSNQISSFLPASKRPGQLNKIMELLYKSETGFLECDYEKAAIYFTRKVRQRSLVVLYTNFETISSMRRNMRYLSSIARYHLMVVVIFKNTEMNDLLESTPKKLKDIYYQVTGEQLAFEKLQIINELNKRGIQTIYTAPENLSAETINKYIEIKSRRLI